MARSEEEARVSRLLCSPLLLFFLTFTLFPLSFLSHFHFLSFSLSFSYLNPDPRFLLSVRQIGRYSWREERNSLCEREEQDHEHEQEEGGGGGVATVLFFSCLPPLPLTLFFLPSSYIFLSVSHSEESAGPDSSS